MLFFMGDDGKIKYPYAPYYGARLLTQSWLSSSGLHELYPTLVSASPQRALKTFSAYAVHRPDAYLSVLLINKDPKQPYNVKLAFQNRNRELNYTAPIELFQYSSAQYVLNDDPSNPVPIKNDPTSSTVLTRGDADSIELPPYSLTLLRMQLQPPSSANPYQ